MKVPASEVRPGDRLPRLGVTVQAAGRQGESSVCLRFTDGTQSVVWHGATLTVDRPKSNPEKGTR